MTEGHVCDRHTNYQAWIGESGGILHQKIIEIWNPEMPFPAFWASKFALKFMLTILVFEKKEGKNRTKIKVFVIS
jgi:hypothetical protein